MKQNFLALIQKYGSVAFYVLAIMGTIGLMIVQLAHAYCNDVDSGYYLSISNRISEGYTLYKDVACGYTPLHIYLCAGLRYLFNLPYNCYWPYLLFQQLLRIGGALFVFGIAREMKAKRFASALAATYVCMLFFKEEGTSVLLEVPSVFWGLAGCYAILKLRDKNPWHGLWMGLLLSFAYLSKQYGLGFLPLALLLIFFSTQRKEWWRRLVAILVGYMIPIIFVILIFGRDFYYVLFPTYGTTFIEGTGVEYTLTMRIESILKAMLRNCTNYALIVVTSLLLLPHAIKQKQWKMYVFCLCGYLGFSLQYYFTLTPAMHYALYMMPFVALLIAWISLVDSPRWLKTIVWLSVVYIFLQRGFRLCERNIPSWRREFASDFIRNMSNYCDENIPPKSVVFLEDWFLEPIYFNAEIMPPLIKEYGYSFGPSGMKYSQAIEQLQQADFAIFKIRTNYTEKSVYYFAEQLFQQIKEYPYNEYAGYYIFDLREKPFQGSLGK